jgi:hypothetical protein
MFFSFCFNLLQYHDKTHSLALRGNLSCHFRCETRTTRADPRATSETAEVESRTQTIASSFTRVFWVRIGANLESGWQPNHFQGKQWRRKSAICQSKARISAIKERRKSGAAIQGGDVMWGAGAAIFVSYILSTLPTPRYAYRNSCIGISQESRNAGKILTRTLNIVEPAIHLEARHREGRIATFFT